MSTTTRPAVSEQPAAGQRRSALYWALLLPALPGAIACVAPRWSAPWTISVGLLLSLSVVLVILLLYGGLYDSPRWRAAFAMVTFDLLAFFTLVVVVRNLGAATWVNWLLGGGFAAMAAIGYGFRRVIAQELFAPRTWLGKAFAGFGAIGAGSAGLLGYATSRPLSLVAGLGVLYMLALVVVLISHAGWVRIEDPNWQPVPQPRRRKRRRSSPART